MESGLAGVVASAASSEGEATAADRTTQRILDAALQVAASVGAQRLTIEDVVRRAGVSRMTVYRRYPRRDDLLEALTQRETQRFLAAVGAGIESAGDRDDRVTEGFIAVIRFARAHPLLRRFASTEPGEVLEAVAAEDGRLLRTGVEAAARQIQSGRSGAPTREVRWVADALVRLLLTYIAVPPTNPDFNDEKQLRHFAHEVLAPMISRALTSGKAGS